MKKSKSNAKKTANKNDRSFGVHARFTSMGLDRRRWSAGRANGQDLDRWSSWASALASRHVAIGAARSRVSMILAASGVVARVLKERYFGAINLFPTVRLAVRQILGPTLNYSEHNTLQLNHEIFHLGRKPFLGGNLASGDPAYIRRPAGYRPLARVFLRLSETDDSVHRQIALSQELVSATTRRIIENTQRVEERTSKSIAGSRSFVFKQNAPPAIADNPSELPDHVTVSGQTNGRRPPGFSELDVSELTDQVIRQIDQRTTAWRERMRRI